MWVKRVLYVVIGGAVLLALGVGSIFWATSGVAEAGDHFLKRVSEGKIAEAYRDLTATSLKAKVSETEFVRILTAMNLPQATSWSFTGRKAENINGQKQGQLQATVNTKIGPPIDLTLRFAHEDGAWKVVECTVPFGHSGPPPPLPPEADIRQLVLDTLSRFAAAINTANFTEFHAQSARPLQIAKSAADLKQAFSTFIVAKMDLSALRGDTLTFDPAPTLVDGALHAQGHIRAGDQSYAFDLNYLLEESIWRVIGINVRASTD